MDTFEDEFAPMQSAAATCEETNGNADDEDATSSPNGETSNDESKEGRSSPSPKSHCKPREEPESIKKWRIEQAKRLEEKDRLEEEAKNALREQAKKELENWHKQHADQLAKLQQAHREASESSEKDIQSCAKEIKPGTEWERVAKLCDFNPKVARNTKDVSRMRSIILQLKQGGSKSHPAKS